MKLLCTSDLHGRINLYNEAFALAHRLHVGALLIGGDLFPTQLKRPSRLLTGTFDFHATVGAQLEFIEGYLAPALERFHDRSPETRILYVPGNHDWSRAVQYLQELGTEATCIHNTVTTVDDLIFLGYGCVTDSTFWVKDYVRRDREQDTYVPSRYPMVSSVTGVHASPEGEYALGRPSIAQELACLPIGDPRRTVCLFHCPPFDTGLDTLYTGSPIGSRAIRDFLLERQPRLSLHGHIHESPYISGSCQATLDATLALNPGHLPQRLHAMILDTDDPEGTLIHSVFGRFPPPRDSRVSLCTRTLKSGFMQCLRDNADKGTR